MRVAPVLVPVVSGEQRAGRGRGPQVLLDAMRPALRDAGHAVLPARRVAPSTAGNDPAALGRIAGAIRRRVAAALEVAHVALVLAPECTATIGAVGALQGIEGSSAGGARGPGVVWFDAHGDFNTPATSPSGLLYGMPVAILVGRALPEVLEGARARPVPEDRVLLAGARDLDPLEGIAIERSRLRVVPPALLREREKFATALGAVGDGRALLAHLDLDVLDPADAPGFGHPAPGGPRPDDLEPLLRAVGGTGRLRALVVTAYDPDGDDGRTLALAVRLVLAALGGTA